MFLTIITFIIILSVLVFVHEWGHFWTARRFGLKPEEFGFGFPPRVWGRYRAKDGTWKTVKGKAEVTDAVDTIYSINLLPIGGFVKLGEDDTEETDDPNHFNNKPIWQRVIILSAGVTMNVVLAAVLISFGFMVGLPQVLGDLNSNAKISERKIQIVKVMKDTPAAEAKLEIEDIIISVNGKSFGSTNELQNFVAERKGQVLTYVIKRKTETIEKDIKPEIMASTNRAGIGIGIAETGIVRYPIHIALWEGIKTTAYLTMAITMAFYDLIKGLVTGAGVSIDIGGPIRIAQITGDAMRMGLAHHIAEVPQLVAFKAGEDDFLRGIDKRHIMGRSYYIVSGELRAQIWEESYTPLILLHWLIPGYENPRPILEIVPIAEAARFYGDYVRDEEQQFTFGLGIHWVFSDFTVMRFDVCRWGKGDTWGAYFSFEPSI